MSDNRALDLLLEASNDALWLWKPVNDEISWGAAWFRLTGLDPETALKPGMAEWHSRLHPDEGSAVLHQFDGFLSGSNDQFESEHRLRIETGDYRWVRLRAHCERNADGTVSLIAGSFTDISEHKILDPYTRLPNRIVFLDRLERSLARLRFGESHAAGVLSIRIHLPASHVDLLNNEEQAQLARILGERISRELRPWDLVAQPDALEYAVLLEMVATGRNIPSITERLLLALRQPVQIGSHTLQVGAAIGSADTTQIFGNEEHLLHAAESAARLAASHGEYCHLTYDPTTPEVLAQQLQIEREIVAALIEQTFEPWFQPIVRLADSAVIGFEVLARWPRQDQVLEPRQFLPLMERNGLIKQLSWIMLQKGLAIHEQWIVDGLIPSDSRLGINLPAEQLLDEPLAEQILALLDDMNIAAQRLRLEIRGKTVANQSSLSREKLAHLRSCGIQIAIDDMGIDPISLQQLQHFPLDMFKIERSLVQELESSTATCGVIRAIVSLAAAMDLAVVAQGVETPGQLTFLREQGVRLAQGFLLSTPLPASKMREWLTNRV
ncbi:MAG: EAL domain-containing protein [Formivibrio sp.]|nr:EAL domain-containing protein [Formivibrio sp.]